MWVHLPPLQPFMLRVAQMVRAPGCGPGGRRFESSHAPHGFLAQLVERQTEDLRVPGPIPGEPTTYGRMPESGQLGRTVNPLPQGCVGSNPTSPTMNHERAWFFLARLLFSAGLLSPHALFIRKSKTAVREIISGGGLSLCVIFFISTRGTCPVHSGTALSCCCNFSG